eukprot:TRINITY_DN44698_c0_g1_i1.p1 TRINITY_DN44698_c0_g1~~TRINITY_DN44698_c0_g1_i1.p1  ORF type:complete len:353 (+),score=64.52 TRINITY_DN44698_c0_g1_i1:78-1136(+)
MMEFVSWLIAQGLRLVEIRCVSLRAITSRLLAHVVQFPSGRRVAVGKVLAEGGFSFVYLANDLADGKQYALKKLICQDTEARDAARAEADVHWKFKHEHLLPLEDQTIEAHPKNPHWEVFWMVLPLCRCSLRDEVTVQVLPELAGRAPTSTWTQAQVLAILTGVCKGLAEMHRAGLSHRDVKPENVLLQDKGDRRYKFGTPMLMDFGSCGPAEVVIRSRREAMREADFAGQFCTVQYRAPELFDVPGDIGTLSYARGDAWAAGCLGYCCFIGYSPFEVDFDHQGRPLQSDCSHLRVLNAIPWPKAGPRSSMPDWLKDLLAWIIDTDHRRRPDIRDVVARLQSLPGADSDNTV